MQQSELEQLSQAIAAVYERAADPACWKVYGAPQFIAYRGSHNLPDTTSPAVAALLQSHSDRAEQLSHHLARLRLDQLLQEGALGAICVGVLIIDATARPLYATPVAQRLLQEERALLTREGRLETSIRSITQQLRLRIERMAAAGDTGRDERYLSIPIPDGDAVQLYIAALPANVRALGFDEACALVYCHEKRSSRHPMAEVLEHLFHLTPAESQVAEALLRGTSLKSHAQQRQLSIHTVKNQLKSIFEKTGHTSQVDFIHDVLSNPLVIVASFFAAMPAFASQ